MFNVPTIAGQTTAKRIYHEKMHKCIRFLALGALVFGQQLVINPIHFEKTTDNPEAIIVPLITTAMSPLAKPGC